MFLSDLCTRTGPVIVAGETRSRSRRSVKRSARFDFPSVEIVMHGNGISDSNGRLLSGPPWILDLRRWSVTDHGCLGTIRHTPRPQTGARIGRFTDSLGGRRESLLRDNIVTDVPGVPASTPTQRASPERGRRGDVTQ